MLRETAAFLEIQLGRMRARWRPDKVPPPPPPPSKKAQNPHTLPIIFRSTPYPDDYSAW
jgi:hypothetical protein